MKMGKKRFWSDLGKILDEVGNQFCIMNNLSGWDGDRVKDDVTGAFLKFQVNMKMVDFSAERMLCISIKYFKHSNRSRDGRKLQTW